MRANRVLRILVVAAGGLSISAMVVSALNPDAYFYTEQKTVRNGASS